MVTVLIILLLFALIFGAGAVFEALAWATIIAIAVVIAAATYAWSRLRHPKDRSGSR